MNSYTSTFGLKNILIGVSGIIGAGKTTLTSQLGDRLSLKVLKEPVESNEYLSKFYENIKKYSFPMQIYLLNNRFRQHQQMVWSRENTIQDRTIYEDVIFAKMLNEENLMEELDFKTYVQLFSNMANFLHRPDLIIYLDVEPQEALNRVRIRSRDCESGITLEYLTKLREGYKEWLGDIQHRIPVLCLDWNKFQNLDIVIEKIRDKLQYRKGLII